MLNVGTLFFFLPGPIASRSSKYIYIIIRHFHLYISTCGFESAILRFSAHAICGKVYQVPTAGKRFPLDNPVSFANKMVCHEIIHMVLKVMFNQIKQKHSTLTICN